ncbi:hypothetical protein [Serratia fonticola]|uniref:hypothetical protein n=1 Tax=Serratia fonticola TaxID=47917 RepID=UPI00093CAAD9|nr:hypothetical protein [Serratia fonticola]OKP29379.1 hypothetical protein BSQ40_09155 [Serratia fonticola]
MAIPYPAWLPLAQKSNKNMSIDTTYRTDMPAVGPAISQPLTDEAKVTWSLTWIFTLDQERAFQLWLRSPKYLRNGSQWFSMPINLGGSGLQMQELLFTQMPVQTSINGSVATWSGTVVSNKLFNSDDDYDDIIVELPPVWWSTLDIVVTETMPKVP